MIKMIDEAEGLEKHICCYDNKCCSCKGTLTEEENKPQTNPYLEDVENDSTLHKLCDYCIDQHAGDI